MNFQCPICGQEVAVTQFDFEEDMCFNCLQKVDIGDLVQPDIEYDHEVYDYDED